MHGNRAGSHNLWCSAHTPQWGRQGTCRRSSSCAQSIYAVCDAWTSLQRGTAPCGPVPANCDQRTAVQIVAGMAATERQHVTVNSFIFVHFYGLVARPTSRCYAGGASATPAVLPRFPDIRLRRRRTRIVVIIAQSTAQCCITERVHRSAGSPRPSCNAGSFATIRRYMLAHGGVTVSFLPP
jgi:hypothetical protein